MSGVTYEAHSFLIGKKQFNLEITLNTYLKHKRDPEEDHHEAIKHAPAVFNIGVLSLETEAGDKTQAVN